MTPSRKVDVPDLLPGPAAGAQVKRQRRARNSGASRGTVVRLRWGRHKVSPLAGQPQARDPARPAPFPAFAPPRLHVRRVAGIGRSGASRLAIRAELVNGFGPWARETLAPLDS